MKYTRGFIMVGIMSVMAITMDTTTYCYFLLGFLWVTLFDQIRSGFNRNVTHAYEDIFISLFALITLGIKLH